MLFIQPCSVPTPCETQIEINEWQNAHFWLNYYTYKTAKDPSHTLCSCAIICSARAHKTRWCLAGQMHRHPVQNGPSLLVPTSWCYLLKIKVNLDVGRGKCHKETAFLLYTAELHSSPECTSLAKHRDSHVSYFSSMLAHLRLLKRTCPP